jgi:cytochrome c peroxidase
MSQPSYANRSVRLISYSVARFWFNMRSSAAALRRFKPSVFTGVLLMLATVMVVAAVGGQGIPFLKLIPNGIFFPNPQGASQTYSTSGGGIDMTGPFFQSLGTNGRSCGSCHQATDGMSLSAADAQLRFFLTQGRDPIFRTVDGSNCDHNIDVSTLQGRAAAYSLLRTRGLFRIAISVPANANYRVVNVENPYGCNEPDTISAYRRPLPATNLRFLSAVMIDGRESSPLTGTTKISYANYPSSLQTDLMHQAMDATNGHAEASPPITISDPRLTPIVNFEMGLSTAQAFDNRAGLLNGWGANGGPLPLVKEPFFITINSSINFLLPQLEQPGGLVTPGDGQFTPNAFNLYDGWAALPPPDPRAAIARGQAIFNSKPINITGVAGINDDVSTGGLVAGGISSLQGTCSTCHDTPNVGDHSFATALNIGTGDFDSSNPSMNLGGLDVSYLPRVTVCKIDSATGLTTDECKTTSDLGQGLIDGDYDHVGKIKGPILRGLAARAPYFHNGSAETLLDVVHFYENRFGLSLTPQQESDLVAFLNSL